MIVAWPGLAGPQATGSQIVERADEEGASFHPRARYPTAPKTPARMARLFSTSIKVSPFGDSSASSTVQRPSIVVVEPPLLDHIFTPDVLLWTRLRFSLLSECRIQPMVERPSIEGFFALCGILGHCPCAPVYAGKGSLRGPSFDGPSASCGSRGSPLWYFDGASAAADRHPQKEADRQRDVSTKAS